VDMERADDDDDDDAHDDDERVVQQQGQANVAQCQSGAPPSPPRHSIVRVAVSLRRNRPHVVPVRLLTTPGFSPFPSSVSTQRGPANGREWELCTSAYPGDEPLASLHRADAPSTWRRAQRP
jgi:hypothetical protein